MKKQKIRINKKNLAIYLLSITIIYLIISNYRLEYSTVYLDDLSTYATKVEIVKK